MDDRALIDGLTARDDAALKELQNAYGGYCRAVAYNVLGSREDAEEIVNDAMNAAWNAIPPARPTALRAYLGKLTRNLALKRVRFDGAQKRGGGEAAAVYEELDGCLTSGETAESAADADALRELLRDFVRRLSPAKRRVFLLRYWYFETVPAIARETGYSEAKVTSLLHRLREQLKRTLTEGGFDL